MSSSFAINGTVTQTSGSVTMSGVGTLGGDGNASLYNINITGTTTLGGTVTSTASTTITGVLNGGTGTLILSASGTPFVVNGTFNRNTSTVIYSGVGGTYISPTSSYYNLIINSTDAGVTNLNSSVIVYNVFTLNGSFFGGSNNISLYGTGTPFVNNGTYTPSYGRITYAGNTSTISAGTYFNISVTGSNVSLGGTVTTTNIMAVYGSLSGSSHTLILTATGTPFVVEGTFNYNSSTVIYSGVGQTLISPTSSYYNLIINSTNAGVTNLSSSVLVHNVFTINGSFFGGSNGVYLYGAGTTFVNNGTYTPSYGRIIYVGNYSTVSAGTYYNLLIDGTNVVLGGNVTTTNSLVINSFKSLNAASYTVRLTADGTSLVVNGTLTASTSNFIYSGATVNIATTTFATLTLPAGGEYTLSGNATSTVAVVNNGTLNIGNYDLVATGDYTNNATTTESGTGRVKKAATGGLTSTSYTSGSANGTGNTVSVSITDPTANLLAGTVETKSVSITGSNFSDSETVTLTETTATSGIFSGSIPFNIASAASANSKADVSGNGTLTLSYSNGYGALSGSGATASYTGSYFASGGGAGGSAPSVTSPSSAATVSAGAQTTSQNITLSLSATNATQVAISEDPGFAGASWEAYSPTKAFTLSKGAGVKTVYVKFMSATGVATQAYKVTVTLNDGYIAAPVVAPVTTNVVTLTAPKFEVSNPDSKVVITPLKTLVYKPNTTLKYTYSYKNEATKTAKVKVLRQVLDINGKVVAKATGSVSIAKGKTFKTNVTNVLNSKLADGTYTVKVQIMDFKTGIVLEENSFDITVKKPAPVVKKPVVKAPVVKKK